MNEKYSVGDKAVTTSKWDNGMGNTVPKGSIVEIIFFNGYSLGANVYTCLYNGEQYIYEEEWLGEVQTKIGEWIPCSERLPEENQNVIACFAHGTVTEMCFYDKKFHGIYDYDEKVIVAWQPLPAPYEVKSDE